MEVDPPAVEADNSNVDSANTESGQPIVLNQGDVAHVEAEQSTETVVPLKQSVVDQDNALALPTDEPMDESTNILPEEPILNRDNPPEVTDETLEEILDAAAATDVMPVAKINCEPQVVNEDQSMNGEVAVDNDLITQNETTDASESVTTTVQPENKETLSETTSIEQIKDIDNKTTDKPAVAESVESSQDNVKGSPSKPKAIGAALDIGIPGLKFTANNIKTAKDGTKMVQIHQSQITPEQLAALQDNPNIKVVFRHVPSGKSYTKTPKHLLPQGRKSFGMKRKIDDLDGTDVYSFDEGEDLQGPAKTMKYDQRTNYGSAKKRAKQRVLPDSGPYSANYTSYRPGMPAKVMLTDLLARVNSPHSKKEIKVHTSQINAEVLANLELNPFYRIALTTKQELPPLVIENVDAKEQAKLEEDAAEIERRETDDKQEEEKMDVVEETEVKEPKKEEELEVPEETEEEKKKRLEQEEARKKEREAKLAEEEEELKKSVMQTQRSRSGRIRKPSKYALDIARLTKRKSVGTGAAESSGDESDDKIITPIPKNITAEKEVPSPPRGRGRPRKSETPLQIVRTEEKDDVKKATDSEKASEQIQVKEKTERKDEATLEKAESSEKIEEKVTTGQEKTSGDSEKEVSSSKNLKDVDCNDKSADDKSDEPTKVADDTQPNTSTEATASNNTAEVKEAQSEAATPATEEEDSDDNEILDNKGRLRKMLKQCSTEEIRSVLLPEAFDSINLGDFLLFKAGQMHKPEGKISFPKLYKQFESLHNDATKEATRYNTLVRRANKVGGDKRMEKIVLMPVYNSEAANSLQISNSSIDAHICGIQRTITTEMIAANSFHLKNKMESPLIRLILPEATAPRNFKPKQPKPLFKNQHQQMFTGHQEPDSTTPDKPKPAKKTTYGQKIASVKYNTMQTKNQMEGVQVRKPTYHDQLKSTGQITLGGMSHQISSKSYDTLRDFPIDSRTLRADVQSAQVAASATSALAQLQATVQQQQEQQQQSVVSTTQSMSEAMALNPVTGELVSVASAVSNDANGEVASQAEQYFVTEDGVPISTVDGADGEARKHLVPIGDGQYVELPEGYSLIQTDEGYIIGQPGSTFTQGEDGNVYITNSDGTTTEITREDIAGAGDDNSAVSQDVQG